MKNRKLGIFLWIFGGVLLAVGLIGLIAYFVISSEAEEAPVVILALSLTGIILSFVLLVIGYNLSFKADKEVKNRIAAYSAYPEEEIGDYKKELDEVRANFLKDNSPNKNRVGVFNFTNSSQCYDFGVLENGKIYYAYLVRAFPPFYSYENLARMTLPAVIVYGTDEYFESNPLALKKIAKLLYEGRNSNILRDDGNFFTNVRLPDEMTEGREVYATTVMAYRKHLPLYYFSDCLFPVIANPKTSLSAFIVDCKYWTNKQLGNFVHSKAHKTVIEEPKDAGDGIFDI